jgi:hypothetical protein
VAEDYFTRGRRAVVVMRKLDVARTFPRGRPSLRGVWRRARIDRPPPAPFSINNDRLFPSLHPIRKFSETHTIHTPGPLLRRPPILPHALLYAYFSA